MTTGGLDENAGDPSYVTYVPAREHEDRDEERAAIHEFEAGYSRAEADRLSWGPRSTARTNGGHSPAAQVIAQPLARRPN